MRKRANQIIVRLSDEELLVLKRKVKENGMTMARFFRVMIVEGEIKTFPPDLLSNMQHQIKGVGRNVNQITKLAHISGKVSLETLMQISAAQEKIEEQLEKIQKWQF